MNLEQLKTTWKTQSVDSRTLQPSGLHRIVSERSAKIRNRINLSIWIEVGLIVAIIVWSLVWLFPYETSMQRFNMGWVVVSSVASFVFYAYKYRILNRIDLSDRTLLANMTELVRRMRWFMRVYDLLLLVVFPAMIVSGFVFGLNQGLAEEGKSFADLSLMVWIISLFVVLFVCAAFVGLGKVYIWFMYGRAFADLRRTLAELEADGRVEELGGEGQ